LPTHDEIRAAMDCLGSLSAVDLRRLMVKSHNGLYEKLIKAACSDPDDDTIELGEPDKINKESAKKLWEAGKKIKDLSAGVDLTDDENPNIGLGED
jgi:hypothetical protein